MASNKKPQVGVCAIVRHPVMRHMFLVSERNDPKCPEEKELLQLPGGKVEFGESPFRTLRREVQEEVGLDVYVTELRPYVVSREALDVHWVTLAFVCELRDGDNDGKLPPNPEPHKHSAWMWLHIDHLGEPAMYHALDALYSQGFLSEAIRGI